MRFYSCVCVSVLTYIIYRALYYQRRWVKLDVDYLRYFDNDKVTTHTHTQMHTHFMLNGRYGSV